MRARSFPALLALAVVALGGCETLGPPWDPAVPPPSHDEPPPAVTAYSSIGLMGRGRCGLIWVVRGQSSAG